MHAETYNREEALDLAKTFRQWMKANFSQDQLRELGQYGANTGWPGLTYYSDTCALYDHFEEDLWEMAGEDAEVGGEPVLEMIARFAGAKDVDNAVQFKNLMVWYGAERIARELTEGAEEVR